MIKVDNRKVISNISRKSLRANRGRNVIAIIAIALTAVLFTALFTIAGTIVNSFQESSFRQAGGSAHGTFKDMDEATMLDLQDDPLIQSHGARLMLGLPLDPPFNKAHVEVSYMDKANAKDSFCIPTTGKLPAEGTNEIAVDTRILKLLGVEPKVGAELVMPYEMGNGTKKADTFTLSGWWEYDAAGFASQAIVSRSYAEQALEGYERAKADQTGLWTLNVMFKNANSIEEDLKTVLENNGYQTDDIPADNYVDIGINWSYLGAQVSGNMDPAMMLGGAGMLLLIVFTGYLIIYNIFQISVTGDIRFYGLLKTLGATPRQIRRIIRRQSLALALVGIPIGLLLGYLVGNLLAPQVMKNMSYTVAHVTANPLIFVGAAAFALVTVLISTGKPGRMAGRVSPVEAVRYTEGAGSKAKTRKGADFKVWRMALANLGRNKKKTVLVVVSLALAVVLLQVTFTFANGFDMDKYLRNFVVTDFVYSNASYFQTNGILFTDEVALPEEAIDTVNAKGGITDAARVYGQPADKMVYEFVTEDYFREIEGKYITPEALERSVASAERDANGKLAASARLYGMEDYAIDQLELVEGDLEPLRDPSQNAIAAVYFNDDYGNLQPDSHWAKLGDTITMRYVEAWEYYDTRTGKAGVTEGEEEFMAMRTTAYRDVTYTVTALVTMRSSMSYRYYGDDEFVLGSETFLRDSQTSSIMSYLFDTTAESNDAMDSYLQDYTENVDPLLDYESKQSYEQEFYSFRNMFLLMGGALSFIIALVGILNFLNAVMTSILTRRREFAMLQSVGMTGKQLKTMLVLEGIFYAVAALAASLVLALASGPLLGNTLTGMFWFFTYRFTIAPVALMTPVFLAFGFILPLVLYRTIGRHSIVERLREAE